MIKRSFFMLPFVLLAAQAFAASHVVTQKGMAFAPETMTVKVGDTVVFKNDDKLTHNVYSRSPGNEFNLKSVKPGDSAEWAFSSPGEVAVRCAIHPKMKMTIKVEK